MVAMRSLNHKLLSGLCLFSILLLGGTVFAAGTNTLFVKCVDETGKALAGAKVHVKAFGTAADKWQIKTADKEGLAKYDKLDDAAYRVVVRPAALAPGLYEPVLLANGAKETITVKCAAGDPLKKFYFEDDALNAQAFEALKAAITSMNEQKFEAAEQQFKVALEINPSDPNTLFYYGVTLGQLKKWDLTQEAFQRSLNMATAQVMAQPKPKDPTAAPPLPSQAVTVQNNAKAMLAMLPGLKIKVEGTELLDTKDYKGAAAKFEQTTKMLPNDSDAHYLLALALGYDKQWDAANKAIENAVKLRPDDKTYADLKNRLVTNAALEKAKAIADAGDKAYNEKDYATALQKYEEALPLLADPTLQASVWVQIGRARTQQGQNDAAVDAYKRAITLAPQNADMKKNLQIHYETVAQKQLNEKQYDQGFATLTQGGISVFERAKKWAGAQATEDLAILGFQHIIKTEPQNAEAYFELGSLYYFNKKDYARAKENLLKYREVGKDPKVLENASNILAVIEKKK
jgi:tetratricopeptide (TPR) repeat protein